MQPLVHSDLPPDIQQELGRLQAIIDVKPTFSERVRKAKTLWERKGGKEGKKAFTLVKQRLQAMCIGIGICNYCEINEATHIEHIYPQSRFPGKAFAWENYMLACPQCNTEKWDKCSLLLEGQLYRLKKGEEPFTDVLAFINPREEDPANFLWLNLSVFDFEAFDDNIKATETIEILALNKRDALKASRKAKYGDYRRLMEILYRIQMANDLDTIRSIYADEDVSLPDHKSSLAEIKAARKASIKRLIQQMPHPSVWHSIKSIASKSDPQWEKIFEALPEALDW